MDDVGSGHQPPSAGGSGHAAGTGAPAVGAGGPGAAPDPFTGRPPVPAMCVASMALVIVAGIYLAAHLPARASLAPAVGLLAASGAVMLVTVSTVARLRDFAWDAFFLVLKWAGLAYLVIAGMLEYVFVYDHTRGSMLVVLTLSLLVFAVDVPMLLAYSVARFQKVRTSV